MEVHRSATLYAPQFVLTAGEKTRIQFSIYAGPKEIQALEATGVGLNEAINYGFF